MERGKLILSRAQAPARPPRQGAWTAFTLVELLVVIAIIVVLAALIVPAFTNMAAANSLTTAGGMVIGEIDLARQTALSQSQEIEVRFYKLPDETGQSKQFRAFQRYRTSDFKPLDRLTRLPRAIIMSASPEFSTVLSSANGTVATQNLPTYGNTDYFSIHFLSSGGTNLDPRGADAGNDRWFLSLKNENAPERATPSKPADNFITIQIDPVTGRTRVFRP